MLAHLATCADCRLAFGLAREALAALPVAYRPRPDRIPVSPVRAAAALLVVTGLAAWGWTTIPSRSDPLPIGGFLHGVATLQVELPEGVRLELSAGTRPAAVAPGEGERRRVQLERGRLVASVRPDTQGFVVECEAGEVRVVGTRFEVRTAHLPSGEPAASVAVFEGRVSLRSAGGQEALGPGWVGYAVGEEPLLVQEGRAVRTGQETDRLLEEHDEAVRQGRAREAAWLAAILLTTGDLPPAALGSGDRRPMAPGMEK